jgi:hypothetical protein
MISAKDVRVSSMQVAAVHPEVEDKERLQFMETDSGVPSPGCYYIAKIYLEKPLPATAMAPDFYVGDEHIPEYSGFKGGIYFKVYDPRFFERNAGKPVRYTMDGSSFHDTSVKLPQPPVDAGADEAKASSLPTKAEVLRK